MKKLKIFFLCILLTIIFSCLVACSDNKQDITGIIFSDATFTYDGTEKKAEISGVLPDGVSVSYENNAATNAGIYNAKAVLSGENYNTLTLDCTLTIKKADITGIAFNDATLLTTGRKRKRK